MIVEDCNDNGQCASDTHCPLTLYRYICNSSPITDDSIGTSTVDKLEVQSVELVLKWSNGSWDIFKRAFQNVDIDELKTEMGVLQKSYGQMQFR